MVLLLCLGASFLLSPFSASASSDPCLFNSVTRLCTVKTRATGSLLPYEADAMIIWPDGETTTLNYAGVGGHVAVGVEVIINGSLSGRVKSAKRSCELIKQLDAYRCRQRIKVSSPTGNVVEYTHDWGV